MSTEKKRTITYDFLRSGFDPVYQILGKEGLLRLLKEMLLIRQFELRAEAAYQQGKIGGFFHAYIGQEAIQTAACSAIGQNGYWITSYRCHALALLLGSSPKELMAELYGKKTGNALGRGGSMHMYAQRLLGGFGIVGGQIPIAAGAAFTLKYLHQKGVSVCFLGDGAVAQGSFHETLNLAALWDLPCIFVVENNQWGMGTSVERAISLEPIAATKAPAYGIQGYTIDGMNIFDCYSGFLHIYEEVLKTSRPVLVEVVTERFRGHSISDPALYRSKELLHECMQKDPIVFLRDTLEKKGLLSREDYKALEDEQKKIVIESMHYAEESPWPDPITLGEDVFAPET